MNQIWIIGGGDVHQSPKAFEQSLKNKTLHYEHMKCRQNWRTWLAEELTNTDVLLPSMPLKDSASYKQWKIIFEKCIPLFEGSFCLVGHSLGGIFLAKYLSENTLPVACEKLILIAAPYNDETLEPLGDFLFGHSLGKIHDSTKQIHLFYSTDDPVVSFSELQKYQLALPSALTHIFNDRLHFNEETFPELKEIISA